jgi:DNA-binding MarR family transcriptional regulator
MKTLIEIQREGERKLGIFSLSSDYEIVYSLMDCSHISPDSLHKLTRLSSTAFYNKLKDLERKGAIISDVNPSDRRGRLYSLSDDMRSLIMNQHKGYMDLVRRGMSAGERAGQNLNLYRSYIKKGNIVHHLSGEFQILLYLYLKSGISNLNISHVVDVSITKFHTSLTKLTSIGLVKYDKDPSDGRSKLYRLSDLTHHVLDGLHAQVFQWLEEEVRRQGASPRI